MLTGARNEIFDRQQSPHRMDIRITGRDEIIPYWACPLQKLA
jgi:hypothetical protein